MTSTTLALDGELVDLKFAAQAIDAKQLSHALLMTRFGVSKERARLLARELRQQKIVLSSTHQVALRRFEAAAPFGGGTWLSIKRLDRQPILNRHVLGQILAALAPAHVGFELLPAPDRLVDTANQYHVFAVSTAAAGSLVGASLTDAGEERAGYSLQTVSLGNEHLPMKAFKPKQLGDWRELFKLKEAVAAGHEGALVFGDEPQHPLDGHVVILDTLDMRFPFGMADAKLGSEAQAHAAGAVQRSLESHPGYAVRGTGGSGDYPSTLRK